MIHVPQIKVPGSKSITNRALVCAALAKGKSRLRGALFSDDTAYMIRALRMLGIKIRKNGNGLEVFGGQPRKSPRKLFCGNAGTAVRFLTAVLASQPFESTIDGDKRMRRRPIKDLCDALKRMGAKVESLNNNGCPPVKIVGPFLKGRCKVKGGISSQFLSGLLLALPLANRTIEILVEGDLVSKPYVDMTIKIMKSFGIKVRRSGYKKFAVPSGQKYRPANFNIEGDASSASYFWGLGYLTDENFAIKNIAKNSVQADAKFLDVLSSEKFKNGGEIDCEDFPDSAMTLAAICACIKGKRILTGLSNLKVKECDRLHALATELRKIGAKTKELKDGIEIIGNPENLRGAKINTQNDHRMAMCFGMLGSVIPGITVINPNCVKKTYPRFWKDLAQIRKFLAEKNIILTGMRGTGKSKIGRQLAAELNRKFIDTDREIEAQAKCKISEIVEKKGWKYFRKLESKIVRKLRNVKRAVIATGGGTMINKVNARILKRNGRVILLDASPNILQKRLKLAKDRPSLTKSGNFLNELAEIYEKRKKCYLEVTDFILDVSKNTRHPRLNLRVARWGIM